MDRRDLFFFLGAISTAALASSSSRAEMPSPDIALQGLLTGDANIDAALTEAFERGFRRGREEGLREIPYCKNIK